MHPSLTVNESKLDIVNIENSLVNISFEGKYIYKRAERNSLSEFRIYEITPLTQFLDNNWIKDLVKQMLLNVIFVVNEIELRRFSLSLCY